MSSTANDTKCTRHEFRCTTCGSSLADSARLAATAVVWVVVAALMAVTVLVSAAAVVWAWRLLFYGASWARPPSPRREQRGPCPTRPMVPRDPDAL
jgi:hypothetical protein